MVINKTKGEEIEEYKEDLIEGFDGEPITTNEFRGDLLNLVDQSIGIELRMDNSIITAQYYSKVELDEYKGEFIFNNEDREIPLMAIPLDSVEMIFRGCGFFDEDKWVVQLKNGLEYLIWLEM